MATKKMYSAGGPVRQRYEMACDGVKPGAAPKKFAKGGSVDKSGYENYGMGLRKTKSCK